MIKEIQEVKNDKPPGTKDNLHSRTGRVSSSCTSLGQIFREWGQSGVADIRHLRGLGNIGRISLLGGLRED